jgi:hypothetical protein
MARRRPDLVRRLKEGEPKFWNIKPIPSTTLLKTGLAVLFAPYHTPYIEFRIPHEDTICRSVFKEDDEEDNVYVYGGYNVDVLDLINTSLPDREVKSCETIQRGSTIVVGG